MGNMNWSKMVLFASLASCSISLGSPVGEAEAVSRYGRGYSGSRGFGLSSRTPRVYSGPYNRGYRGQYSSDRHGYHGVHKKHDRHILSRHQSQHRVEVVPAEEVDRFIPVTFKQADQRIFIEDSVPSLGIMEQIVNPSFSVEIDFNDDARDIISEPLTNSVDNIISVQQSEPEDLVFNFPAVPSADKLNSLNNNIYTGSTATGAEVSVSVSATQQKLIEQILRQKQQQAQEIDNILNASSEEVIIQNSPKQQNSPLPIPPPTFKFPPRIPAEAPVPPPVQQPLSVQPPSPNLPPPVLPQAIPAVPGRPVLVDNAVQRNAVQSVQTVQQSRFIPMPVPAVPNLSN